MTNIQEAETRVDVGDNGKLNEGGMDIGMTIIKMTENYISLC